jgi:hypothetical protein
MKEKERDVYFGRGEIKFIIVVKTTAPMIAHTTGKAMPPTCKTNSSGKSNFSAIHLPITAPIKPTTTERKHPPLVNPVKAFAMDPVMPAMMSKMINSVNDIFIVILSVI